MVFGDIHLDTGSGCGRIAGQVGFGLVVGYLGISLGAALEFVVQEQEQVRTVQFRSQITAKQVSVAVITIIDN